MSSNISKKTGKPKRQLSQKQLDALAKGRAKRAENLKNGITKSKLGWKNTADYLTGLVHGIELDKRVAAKEVKSYNRVLDNLSDNFGVDVEKITDPKVKQYVKRKLTQKQLDALAREREGRSGKVNNEVPSGQELLNKTFAEQFKLTNIRENKNKKK